VSVELAPGKGSQGDRGREAGVSAVWPQDLEVTDLPRTRCIWTAGKARWRGRLRWPCDRVGHGKRDLREAENLEIDQSSSMSPKHPW
jgi:hypothetical protein